VQALKVGDFGGVAGFRERFKAGIDEGGDAAAEDSLFAEEVRFGFFAERGFDDAGLERTEALGIGEGIFAGVAGGILVDGDEGGDADAFRIEFAANIKVLPGVRWGLISAS
jgi:hypothetical protein